MTISQGFPEKQTNRMPTYEEIYYKKLTHVIMKVGKSQDLDNEPSGQRLRRADSAVLVGRLVGLRPRKTQCFSLGPKAGKSQCLSLKAVRQEEFSLSWGRVRFFVLARPSTSWTRPTHSREGNLLYSVY